MTDLIRTTILSQFEAAMAMMNDCLVKCPEEHWQGKIANYSFWQVAYHTLFFVDYYLSPGEEAFVTRPGLHPPGWKDGDEEVPERTVEKREMIEYMAICLRKLREAMAAETAESLARPCGFSRRKFSRAELYIYNMRHIMHHTGQLSAFLRRVDVRPNWVSAGWK